MPVMDGDLKLEMLSISADNTEHIAQQTGKQLKGGETIVLSSDLGGGKTVFAKGLAKGAGSADLVSSPTFTISKVYNCPNFDIQHFDFYRLDDPGIISLELIEAMSDQQSVVIIEWADIVKEILPTNYMKVVFGQLEQSNRLIKFSCPKQLKYLLKDLK